MGFNFKAEAKIIFITIALVGILGIVGPPLLTNIMSKKRDTAIADLKAIANLAMIYKEEEGVIPNSLIELERFAQEPSAAKAFTLPQTDPWNHEYAYYPIAPNRIVIVAKGRNGIINTSHEFLATASAEKPLDSREDMRCLLTKQKDDWIYIIEFNKTSRRERLWQ